MKSAIPRNVRRLLSLAFCLAITSGCSTWNLNKATFWPFGNDKPGTPDKIVAIWTDTVLYKSNQTPGRGFGGRVMFYQAKNEQPIKVDGSIVVYAFDETNRAAGSSRPDRKYVFTPDQIPAHYSKSKIGHSYSLWIPWDEVGGPQKEITLVVRFEPKGEAGVVVSEPTRQLLPGMTTSVAPEVSKIPTEGAAVGMTPAQSTSQPVQQASYNAATPPTTASANADPPARRMTTTTISVPSEMAHNPLLAGRAASSGIPNGRVRPQETLNSAPQRLPPLTNELSTLTPTSQPPSTAVSTQPGSGFRPRSRFSPPRSRALAGSSAQQGSDRAPWTQCPGESPSAPGVPPESESGSGSATSLPGAGSATY